MARPPSHKRPARLAVISIISLVSAFAAIWAAPRVSSAVEHWMTTPPVEMRSSALAGSLPVTSAAATSEPAGKASSGAAGAPTIDAGMRFTMAGVTCAPPRARAAASSCSCVPAPTARRGAAGTP